MPMFRKKPGVRIGPDGVTYAHNVEDIDAFEAEARSAGVPDPPQEAHHAEAVRAALREAEGGSTEGKA